MKAVLLAINAKYVHSSLAVWCLAAGVKRYAAFRHDIYVVETAIHQDIDAIAMQVAEYMPEVIGISAYIWNSSILPELMARLREYLPEIIIVLGGPEVSFNREYWLALGSDYVIQGEGERSFPALLDTLTSGKDIKTGLPEPLTEPVDPYDDNYFNALNKRIVYLETSRGCPFSCAYCLSGETKPRFFPIEYAKKQLSRLALSGTRTIKLVDRTFNCDADRAYELFSYIISLDTDVCFHFEVAADLFDDRALDLLKTAPPGRIQLEIGLQSFYPPALKAASRCADTLKSVQNIKKLMDGGNIHIHTGLIAGLPYETLSDFADSFNRAYALGAHHLQLGFLKLLHGSVLREQAREYGICYNPNPPYEIISSPWLSTEDFSTLKQTENALQRAYNRGRFYKTLHYMLSTSGLTPFAFYQGLGAYAPNHGEQLGVYAEKIYLYCLSLPGIDAISLRDSMVCDWLRSTRGENMPSFLKIHSVHSARLADIAKTMLGHELRRGESVVLASGHGVFIDSRDRDPVTGLYALHIVNRAMLTM